MWVMLNLISVRWEPVSVQDWCTVSAEHTIGSEIVLVHLETVFVSVQDRCMICNEHTIGSEIILDAPNFTPR